MVPDFGLRLLTQFHNLVPFSNHRSNRTIHLNTPGAPSSVILFAERLLKSGSDEGFEGHEVFAVASFHSRVSVLFQIGKSRPKLREDFVEKVAITHRIVPAVGAQENVY